ncbi:MAG: hypothetical protein K6E20_04415 [Acholeplasmatales bacterium]|nr:hypothetical protein [Acholeplasmatales bacterium]
MKYLKISSVLALISLVCAVILAGINLLTKDKIEQNETDKKNDTIQAIYSDYDSSKSQIQSKKDLKQYDSYSSVVDERIIACNTTGTVLGYLYTVSGSNSYGNISLMVALTETDGKVLVQQVEFLENSESFASTVDTWLKNNFVSKGTEVHEGGFVSKSGSGTVKSYEELASVDTSCGATYGAKTCMELIEAACKLEKEVK